MSWCDLWACCPWSSNRCVGPLSTWNNIDSTMRWLNGHVPVWCPSWTTRVDRTGTWTLGDLHCTQLERDLVFTQALDSAKHLLLSLFPHKHLVESPLYNPRLKQWIIHVHLSGAIGCSRSFEADHMEYWALSDNTLYVGTLEDGDQLSTVQHSFRKFSTYSMKCWLLFS